MASGITTAFWSMTINNYDETDLALVRQGYPDFMRELVYTLEEGEEGTPHIQAWIKLQRQQRMRFVQKLFPRGHFKPSTADEYNHNTKNYAQKLDGTARSPAVHRFVDPYHTVETVIKKVCLKIYEDFLQYEEYSNAKLKQYRYDVEKLLVQQDYRYAKIFVSGVYNKMWSEFGSAVYHNIIHTHTHTHSDENLSHQGGITHASHTSSVSSQCDSPRPSSDGSSDTNDED